MPVECLGELDDASESSRARDKEFLLSLAASYFFEKPKNKFEGKKGGFSSLFFFVSSCSSSPLLLRPASSPLSAPAMSRPRPTLAGERRQTAAAELEHAAFLMAQRHVPAEQGVARQIEARQDGATAALREALELETVAYRSNPPKVPPKGLLMVGPGCTWHLGSYMGAMALPGAQLTLVSAKNIDPQAVAEFMPDLRDFIDETVFVVDENLHARRGARPSDADALETMVGTLAPWAKLVKVSRGGWYKCWHVKMLLQVHELGIRVVIHSGNLTKDELCKSLQNVWSEDFQFRAKPPAPINDFGAVLARMVGSIPGLPGGFRDKLLHEIGRCDFNTSSVDLILVSPDTRMTWEGEEGGFPPPAAGDYPLPINNYGALRVRDLSARALGKMEEGDKDAVARGQLWVQTSAYGASTKRSTAKKLLRLLKRAFRGRTIGDDAARRESLGDVKVVVMTVEETRRHGVEAPAPVEPCVGKFRTWFCLFEARGSDSNEVLFGGVHAKNIFLVERRQPEENDDVADEEEEEEEEQEDFDDDDDDEGEEEEEEEEFDSGDDDDDDDANTGSPPPSPAAVASKGKKKAQGATGGKAAVATRAAAAKAASAAAPSKEAAQGKKPAASQSKAQPTSSTRSTPTSADGPVRVLFAYYGSSNASTYAWGALTSDGQQLLTVHHELGIFLSDDRTLRAIEYMRANGGPFALPFPRTTKIAVPPRDAPFDTGAVGRGTSRASGMLQVRRLQHNSLTQQEKDSCDFSVAGTPDREPKPTRVQMRAYRCDLEGPRAGGADASGLLVRPVVTAFDVSVERYVSGEDEAWSTDNSPSSRANVS